MSLRTYLPIVATLLSVLIVYLITMPQVITLEDAGLFQMICHQGGIGHPPGYPLFVLSCQAFVNLPFFSTDVFAGNLYSALIAVAACGVLFQIACELGMRRSVALMTAAAYGFSQTFWSQAIIVEVYSLAALLFLLCLLFSLRFRNDGRFRELCWLTFFYSLALSNHWPLQGLSTPALVFVLLPRLVLWWDLMTMVLHPKRFAILLALLIAGLLPYLSLFQPNPEIAVFGGIQGFDEFLRYINRSLYSDHFEVAGWDDRYQFQVWIGLQSLQEFSIWLLPIVVLGAVLAFRRLGIAMGAGLVLLYLGSTSLLIALLGFEFNELRQAIFKPYPVIAYASLAIWLGLGVEAIVDHLADNGDLSDWWPRSLPMVIALVVLLANLGHNYRGHSTMAESYGRLVLASVPKDSVLFVEGDNGAGLIGYLHHVEGLRPDIELRNWDNLVFSNRLASPVAPDTVQESARQAFFETTQRPVFSTDRRDGPVINHGLVFELGDRAGFVCDRTNHELIEQLVLLEQEQLLKDGHERYLLFGLLMDLTRQHVGLLLYSGSQDNEELATLLTLQKTFAGKLASLETLIRSGTPKAQLQQLVDGANAQLPAGLHAQVYGVLAEYEGRIALMEPADTEAAVKHFRRSIDVYPSDKNTSLCDLIQLSDQDSARIYTRFPELTCDG